MRAKALPSVHEYHLFGCFALCAISILIVGGIILVAAFVTRVDWTRQRDVVGYVGNIKRGKILVAAYGCPACHTVDHAYPGGLVGPSLDDIGGRSYIAGRFPNEEISMTLWLQHPQRLKPGTGMPDLNVSERDALDMAAYLATLR